MVSFKFKKHFFPYTILVLFLCWVYVCLPAEQYLFKQLIREGSKSLFIIASSFYLIWKIKSKSFISHSENLNFSHHFSLIVFLHFAFLILFSFFLFSPIQNNLKNFSFLALHSSYFLFCLFFHSKQALKLWWIFFLCTVLIFLRYPIEIFITYPIRIFNAIAICKLFNFFNLKLQLGTQAILLFENQATQIENACSGIRSLLVGTILFLSLSLIYSPRNLFKWFIKFLLFIFCILTENFLRISILVYCEFILKQYQLSQLIHQPLGILGFIVLCLIAFLLLKQHSITRFDGFNLAFHSGWSWIFSFIILFTLFIFRPTNLEKNKINFETPIQQSLQASYLLETIPFSKQESLFFNQQEIKKAFKQKFQFKSLSGSLLITLSSSWRGQHNPSQCYEGAGIKVEESETLLLEENFPIRLFHFPNQDQSGSYWFQTQNFKTDDFSTRAWSDLKNGPKDWWLVSILFDKKQKATNPDFIEFHQTLSKLLEEKQL